MKTATILAIGKIRLWMIDRRVKNNSRSFQRAFTLVEMLLVFALFGLISGLVISRFDNIQLAFENYNPVWVLKQGIQKMRFLASRKHKVLCLEYTDRVFQIKDEMGEVIASKELPSLADNPLVGVEFFRGEYTDDGFPRVTHQQLKGLVASQDGCLANTYVKLKWSDRTEIFHVAGLTGGLVGE